MRRVHEDVEESITNIIIIQSIIGVLTLHYGDKITCSRQTTRTSQME